MKNNPFLSILIPLWGVVSLLAGCADGGDAVYVIDQVRDPDGEDSLSLIHI